MTNATDTIWWELIPSDATQIIWVTTASTDATDCEVFFKDEPAFYFLEESMKERKRREWMEVRWMYWRKIEQRRMKHDHPRKCTTLRFLRPGRRPAIGTPGRRWK